MDSSAGVIGATHVQVLHAAHDLHTDTGDAHVAGRAPGGSKAEVHVEVFIWVEDDQANADVSSPGDAHHHCHSKLQAVRAHAKDLADVDV
eukprot:CAMPEP_0202925312 /NCGR_PEP_ID=MMETSP1392-20130828/79435_1 /ASSEMBLY_ACC=CAM_ASM_000868 /TAXON_ID=225041 /ORGANISM="Chlamydomonas chlamydogama, Strain SAG 11-48b" /LENGTH=89 /DNA_ID=CAMNT_0049619089 /DNA_START=750 /DNA_END=1016 /DNA_ORIENTATION=-